VLSIDALLVLSACEHAPADSGQRSDAVVMLQPSGLRSVPQANLRARILIDNTSYRLDAAFAENNNSMVCESNFEPDKFELSESGTLGFSTA